MPENPNDMAGVSSDHVTPQEDRKPEQARQVFPVMFEKDYLDFQGVREEVNEGPLAPKSSSAQVSVAPHESTTGLEDLSDDDLETTVPSNVEKDKNPQTLTRTEPGQQSSSEATSHGKTKPPAKT